MMNFELREILDFIHRLKLADISKYDDFVNGKKLKELFAMDEEQYVLENMLNRKKSFE